VRLLAYVLWVLGALFYWNAAVMEAEGVMDMELYRDSLVLLLLSAVVYGVSEWIR